MAFMTNREFAEHEYNRQKRNAYADALVREVRKLREENEMLKKQLESSQRRERAARCCSAARVAAIKRRADDEHMCN